MLLVLCAVLAVAGNAFFVAVEWALLGSRRDRLEHWIEQGTAPAVALTTFDDRDRQLAITQVGVACSSILLGWLAVAPLAAVLRAPFTERVAAERWLVAATVAVALVVIAVLHVALGAIVPRAVAVSAPERVLCRLSGAQRRVAIVLAPATTVATWLAAGVTGLLGVVRAATRRDSRSSDEIARMVDESRAGGRLQHSEHELLLAALSFRGRRVRDVMAPRRDLVTVPHTATIEQAAELVHRSGHSRVLVLGSDGEQVVGFLHAKDLIALGEDGLDEPLPAGLVRVALWVRPDEPLEEVLPRMRRARRHVAVVLDGTSVLGLVTLEDLLESIVGDIRDETDRPTQPRSGDDVGKDAT